MVENICVYHVLVSRSLHMNITIPFLIYVFAIYIFFLLISDQTFSLFRCNMFLMNVLHLIFSIFDHFMKNYSVKEFTKQSTRATSFIPDVPLPALLLLLIPVGAG